MPDPDPKPDPTPDPDPKPDPDPAPATDMAAEAEKWKALARKHEASAKSNADAAKKLADLEAAGKTETEKLTDKASEAEKRAAEAEGRALRLEVAAEKGLTPAQAKRLVGSTREELEADADEILETFGEEKPKPGGRPKENLKGGSNTDTDAPDERDPRKLAASVPRRAGF